MTTPEEQRRMFGLTLDEVIAEKPAFYDPGLFAMAILSDVQGLLERSGDDRTARERARQWINKAKYWIDQQRIALRGGE